MGLSYRFRELQAFLRLCFLRTKQKPKLKRGLSNQNEENQKPFRPPKSKKKLIRNEKVQKLSKPTASECSFLRFQELPTEIRLIIWKLALPGPRTVTLELRALKTSPFIRSGRIWSKWPIESLEPPQGTETESFDETGGESYIEYPERFNLSNLSGFTSNATPPAILFVCHEAFDVASKFYTKSFGAFCAAPTIWSSFERDTLLLDGTISDGRRDSFHLDNNDNNFLENIVPRLSLKDIRRVQNLALGLKESIDDPNTLNMWLIWTVSVFKGLKTLAYEFPWTAEDPRHSFFTRLQFLTYFQSYKEEYDKSGVKREEEFREGRVMPMTMERCISEF